MHQQNVLSVVSRSKDNAGPSSIYRVVPAHRDWHIETAGWNWAGFLHWGFRNLLAAIWAVS